MALESYQSNRKGKTWCQESSVTVTDLTVLRFLIVCLFVFLGGGCGKLRSFRLEKQLNKQCLMSFPSWNLKDSSTKSYVDCGDPTRGFLFQRGTMLASVLKTILMMLWQKIK